MQVELYDWDNAGDEVLGEIELSCDKLHELGTELGLYRVGRALTEEATSLRNEAEQKASTILVIQQALCFEFVCGKVRTKFRVFIDLYFAGRNSSSIRNAETEWPGRSN